MVLGLACIAANVVLFRALATAGEREAGAERVRLLREERAALELQTAQLEAQRAEAKGIYAQASAELERALAALEAGARSAADKCFERSATLVDSTGRRVCENRVVDALVGVFANLLDNAIRACAALPEGQRRYIDLQAGVRDGFLLVELRKSCPSTAGACR